MKSILLIKPNNRISGLFVFLFLLTGLNACKKADTFYEKLQTLPQVDNSAEFAYKPAYVIGDTMVITGKLYPGNNLQITIGGENATILGTATVKDSYENLLDQVSLLITDGMKGKSREVKITSGGYSALSASVDIYTVGGPGSFEKNLQSVMVKSFTNGDQNIFLHCQNGKGDVYYYSALNKDLRHITKDGTETILYDLSGLLHPGGISITGFIAGGVDTQGQQLYFSARTSPSDYVFCKINLASQQLTILNQSQNIAAPYEGTIATVKMIISGVYPDTKGNVYLAIGFNQKESGVIPDAIARYNSSDGRISYLYKKLIYQNNYPGMPGTTFSSPNNLLSLRFSPDENLFYAFELSQITPGRRVIEVYDLNARIKLHDLSTIPIGGPSLYNVIGPFSGLQIDLSAGDAPDNGFGFLPMPGKRLQVLLFQYGAASYGFPKWIVFDFTDQRTYAYAAGRYEQNGFIFQPTSNLFPHSNVRDELLNYDEDGNLYATANGKAELIRTQPVN